PRSSSTVAKLCTKVNGINNFCMGHSIQLNQHQGKPNESGFRGAGAEPLPLAAQALALKNEHP
ncbi:MAG: hypothetical protein AAF086_10075, partial [Planctomycetota bacterium]